MSPSGPGDLLLGRVFMTQNSSGKEKGEFSSWVCVKDSLGRSTPAKKFVISISEGCIVESSRFKFLKRAIIITKGVCNFLRVTHRLYSFRMNEMRNFRSKALTLYFSSERFSRLVTTSVEGHFHIFFLILKILEQS